MKIKKKLIKLKDKELNKENENSYTTIDINNKANCPGYLLKLIEDAEEIHLVETCATNFIYHCQYKKIIIIPPCLTYGDTTSIFSLLFFLLEYYNHVYLYLGENGENCRPKKLLEYWTNLISNHHFYNKRLFVIEKKNTIYLLNKSKYGEYHICNLRTNGWGPIPSDLFKNHKSIDPKFYYNFMNPFYNNIDIPVKYLCKPNIQLPLKKNDVNHIVYYKLIGLNNNVRMDFFNYERNPDFENITKNNILKSYNIGKNEKYNVTISLGQIKKIKKYVKNSYTTIDINNQANCPGYLLKLIEDAEEIHLVETCATNFIYHCQYKKIMNPNKKIVFHKKLRYRKWDNLNLDYSWKMFIYPMLNNWTFI